jgi:uncharacterized protein YrrD
VSIDLGEPASYLTLSEGTPVYASGGEEVGRVSEVVAAPQQDIFEGIVISSGHGVGRHRFAEAARISKIGEHGVLLSLDAAACKGLPPPR